jgi:hypothetical protein
LNRASSESAIARHKTPTPQIRGVMSAVSGEFIVGHN